MKLLLLTLFIAAVTAVFLRFHENKKIEIILFTVYFLGLATVTFLSRIGAPAQTVYITEPFHTYGDFFHFLYDAITKITHLSEPQYSWVTEFLYNATESIAGNILLFIPLGAFVGKFLNKKILLTVLICLAISLAIETLQYATALGWFDPDDIINNTLGACIGALIFKHRLEKTA